MFILFKRVEITISDFLIKRFGFQNQRREIKFLQKFLIPLFTQVSRSDDQQLSFPLRPLLTKDDACFNRLTQAYFVCQDCTFRQRRMKRKQSRLYLMRVKVYLRIL